MRILIVEDDEAIATAIAQALTQQHYVVDVAAEGEAGWELATVFDYDLILLDVMLPKLDGISLCRQLRREKYQMPILLLTARDSGSDKVIGLDAGADDYVVKPFDFQELTARIRALVRRNTSTLPPILEWGSLRLDPGTCEVTYDHQTLHLTPKEYGILELFLRNSQRVFSRSTIIDHLWALENPPTEDTIKSHIKSLRQKLKAAGALTDVIETVYGLGYRLRSLSPEQERKNLPETELELNPVQQTILAVAKAREDFIAKLGDRLAVLKQATNALTQSRLNEELRQAAEQEAHKLAGSLGSFGFAQGSQLAHEIEQILQVARTHVDSSLSMRLRELVTQLQQEIELVSVPTSAKPELSQQHPLLLIVSKQQQFVELLIAEAARQKMQVETVTDPAAARQAIASTSPDIVLLDLDFPQDANASLRLLAELSNCIPLLPILIFTDQNHFTARLEVARRGGQGFLLKSMPPTQLLAVVAQKLQRFQATKTKVMIVDDDPQVLNSIQNLLQPWGITLANLQDPKQFWDVLREFSPDLLIIDVEMLDLSGIDLCQVVRNDPYWKRLPVLFLTTYIDADIVQQMFAAGADDCILKPFKEPELLTRILNRLERIQLLQPSEQTPPPGAGEE